MITDLGRREFISSLAAMSAAAAFRPRTARAQEAKRPKLRLAFKYNMIKINGSVEDKLNLAKKLGMEGVEVDSPSTFNKDEVKAASKKTGIKIHGVIDSVHWRDTLSDPDEAVRAKGLASLRGAIEDAAFFECDTVLLECSPKVDPCVMRVQQPFEGRRILHERQEAQSGADHQEAA